MRPFEEPAVAGDRLLVSHADFERSCFVLLWQEQQNPLPNNAIIATLCNAVRLSREHCEMMSQPIGKQAELLAVLEKCEATLLEAQRYFGTTCVLPLATEMIPEALAAIRAVKGEKL